MSQTKFSEAGALAQVAIWLSRFSALWILAITLLICADITGRTVFATPIRGVTELVSLSLVAIVFLGVTHGLLSGRITRAEVLIGWLETHRVSGAALLNSVYCVVGAVLSLIIAFATWPLFTTALRSDEFLGVEGDFTVVVWPVMLIVVVGSGLLGATLAVSSLHHAKNWLSEARGGLRALQDWRVLLPLAGARARASGCIRLGGISSRDRRCIHTRDARSDFRRHAHFVRIDASSLHWDMADPRRHRSGD